MLYRGVCRWLLGRRRERWCRLGGGECECKCKYFTAFVRVLATSAAWLQERGTAALRQLGLAMVLCSIWRVTDTAEPR